MKRYSTSDVVDVVVIGTGAGGAPVLERLAKAGLSVVALEAGQWRDPANEYAADEIAAADLYWLGDRLSAGHTPTAFGANNSGTGVGGSTLHWGAFVPRADPRDMRLYTETGHAVDWPLNYDELLPYYEEVERFIGVSGPDSYPWEPGRRFPLPPVPLNAPARAIRRRPLAGITVGREWVDRRCTGERLCRAPIRATCGCARRRGMRSIGLLSTRSCCLTTKKSNGLSGCRGLILTLGSQGGGFRCLRCR